jgi:hypothetical protein
MKGNHHNCHIATLGRSWNFISAENRESLSLQLAMQDRPRGGIIITWPASHPVTYIEKDKMVKYTVVWGQTTFFITLKF